jgi:hypothetical protein
MRATGGLLLGIFFALCGNMAAAGEVLTFEGLQNFEPVANYYNGGKGGLGTGPGPNYGITFSATGVAFIPGKAFGKVTPFPNDPSPPTVLLDADMQNPAGQSTAITMNVSGGFSKAMIFYYLALDGMLEIKIYSGLNGAGMKLADQKFAKTGQLFSNEQAMEFPGTAKSVVFTGGNDQLALDNISFASVPEPAGWITLMTGLGCLSMAIFRRRQTASESQSIM